MISSFSIPPWALSLIPATAPLYVVNIAVVVVAASLLWIINAVPIPFFGFLKIIFNIIVILAVIAWFLYGFGVLSELNVVGNAIPR